jgi:transcriptional regulator of acetoin/glycerol metabolism
VRTYSQTIERARITYLRRVLEAHNWNVTRAAAAAGLDRRSLHELMRRFKLSRPSAVPIFRGVRSVAHFNHAGA